MCSNSIIHFTMMLSKDIYTGKKFDYADFNKFVVVFFVVRGIINKEIYGYFIGQKRNVWFKRQVTTYNKYSPLPET